MMNRFHTTVLILATVLGSWLGMQAVHEFGHVLGAWATGAKVERVVLHPLTISRTDLGRNPRPLLVVWAGPVIGVLLPLVAWGISAWRWRSVSFLFRFFAGFCLIANGVYIGFGSWERIGDCGDLLKHGAAIWQLWLFGLIATPAGLLLWNGQGRQFGIGKSAEQIRPAVAYSMLSVCLLLLLFGLAHGDGPMTDPSR
jgi:hypothetical protein